MNQINTNTLSAYTNNNHSVLTYLNEYYTRAEVGFLEDEEENTVYITHINETTGSKIIVIIEKNQNTEDYRLSIDFVNRKNGAFSRRIFNNENTDILDVQKYLYHNNPVMRRSV